MLHIHVERKRERQKKRKRAFLNYNGKNTKNINKRLYKNISLINIFNNKVLRIHMHTHMYTHGNTTTCHFARSFNDSGLMTFVSFIK